MKHILMVICCLSMHLALAQSSQDKKISSFAGYPGGPDKLFKFINDNLRYPADAKRDSLVGDVFVEFVVSESGSIEKESLKIIKGMTQSCDREAMRLISSSAKWTPAISEGLPIKQVVTFPISFRLENLFQNE